MLDSAVTDALGILAKGQLLATEEMRETRALHKEIVKQLGQICSQNTEFLEQMESLQSAARDSERNIRVLRSDLADVIRRLQPIEADYKASKRASSG